MNGGTFSIRHEVASDRERVYQVEAAAFGQENEARLVEALREAGHALLSLVVEMGDEIVGHVMFSPMTVSTETDTSVAICLGPMAIAPSHQNQGIGTQLMETALRELRGLVSTAVFLAGDAAFYSRFGFRPASEFDVHYPDGADAFMALELTPGALEHVSGTARLAPEFDLLA